MESNDIVLSTDAFSLLLEKGSDLNSVQLVISPTADSASSMPVVPDTNISSDPDHLGSVTEKSQSKALALKYQEIDMELKTLKAAILPVTDALLRNSKLANGIGNSLGFDKNSTACMVEILLKAEKYISNYERIEQQVKLIQEQLSKSVKARNELISCKKKMTEKLQTLSQSIGLEDILSQLRAIFKDSGIDPGPLFKLKTEESKSLDKRPPVVNTVEEVLPIDPPDFSSLVYDTLYKIDAHEDNGAPGQLREDGTFDDSEAEMADYHDDEDSGDWKLANTVLDMGDITGTNETNDTGKRYSFRTKRTLTEKVREILKPRKLGRPPNLHRTKAICTECGKDFRKPAHLRIHMRVHTGEKPYKCSHCDKTFRLKNQMADHERLHTGEKPYTCEICGKTFRKCASFSNHKNLHSKPFECQECGHRVQFLKQLKVHMRNHTGERPCVCDVCGTGFISMRTLNAHKKKLHQVDKDGTKIPPVVKENATCTVCNKVVRKYGLPQHMLIHEEQKPYACEFCGRCFAQKQCMVYHIKRIHQKELNYQCSLCGKWFVRNGELNHHMRVHNEDRQQWKCEVCDKVLVSKDGYNLHMTLHSEEKKFKCDHCDKTFYNIRSMLGHMKRVHEGPEFECEDCGRVLASQSGLKNHKLIHTGEKPHECDVCGTRFRKKDTMNKHRAHHKPSKYSCAACGDQFQEENQLLKHAEKCDTNCFVVIDNSGK